MIDVTDISDTAALITGLLHRAEKLFAELEEADPNDASLDSTRKLLSMAREILETRPEYAGGAGVILDRALDDIRARRDRRRLPRPRPWDDAAFAIERWRLMSYVRRAEKLLKFPDPLGADAVERRALLRHLVVRARRAIDERDEETIETTRQELRCAILGFEATQRN